MADALVRLHSEPALPPGRRALRGGVVLHVPAPRAYVRLQLARRHADEAGDIRVLDLALPTTPNRCHGDDPALLWMAPDGWLLTASGADGAGLQRAARAACGDRVAAAVDVSDALVALELHGARTRELLARGTGVDLSPDALGPGQCTRTRLAQLAVILRPRARDAFELILDRAPAAWLCDWLEDAAAGLDT